MLEILEFSFFQNALMAGFLVSIACAIIGSLMMINRLFSMAGSITHGAFGGIGIAFYFSLPIFLSTSIFTLFIALLIAYLSKKYKYKDDNIIAVIWAFGMAIGIILVDLSPKYGNDLLAYLFGGILSVYSVDLYIMTFIDILFLTLIFCFYRQFEAISFDIEFAKICGINTNFFYYLLIAMMAFCIVICIKLIGLILVIALLSIPSFIAYCWAKKLGIMMIISFILSFLFCIIGLFISYIFDLSAGACIILSACAGFCVNLMIVKFSKR